MSQRVEPPEHPPRARARPVPRLQPRSRVGGGWRRPRRGTCSSFNKGVEWMADRSRSVGGAAAEHFAGGECRLLGPRGAWRWRRRRARTAPCRGEAARVAIGSGACTVQRCHEVMEKRDLLLFGWNAQLLSNGRGRAGGQCCRRETCNDGAVDGTTGVGQRPEAMINCSIWMPTRTR